MGRFSVWVVAIVEFLLVWFGLGWLVLLVGWVLSLLRLIWVLIGGFEGY